MNVILACTKTGGVGINGRMAWKCPEELALFRKITEGHTLIVGRKTAMGLPYLENRNIIVLSRDEKLNTRHYKNSVVTATTLEDALRLHQELYSETQLFLAGGADLYTHVFTKHLRLVAKLYISIMDKLVLTNQDIDLSIIRKNFTCEELTEVRNDESTLLFTHMVCTLRPPTFEREYLSLLSDLTTRPKRMGRNGEVYSKFHHSFSIDLRNGFPLLTTKKMFFRGVVEELLFFLRGDTDSKLLEEKNINIWKGNTSREFLDKHGFTHREEGDMGPMYGYQWRRFNGDEEKGDQLREVIHCLKHDKESRRILLTDYNPLQAKQGVLFPCHSIIIQFYVEGGYLDMFVYNRSSDVFLGLPFNIASSALLLEIIAKTVDLQARHMHLTLGDAHLYKDHLKVAQQQLELMPCILPRLSIKARLNCVEHIENLRYEHFYLDGYVSHPSIKAEMVA